MKTKIVSTIEKGTVIDHLKAGTALKVAKILDLFEVENRIILGKNLESKKMGKKDIIKVEHKMIDREHFDKIAIISPNATINIIKNHKVSKKIKVEIPDFFDNIIKCRNPGCVSRKESVPSKFKTLSKNPIKVKCNYCEKVFMHFELL